jgi:hypothetical protein
MPDMSRTRVAELLAIAKHPGPDGGPIHSTGSAQDAHGGEGGGGGAGIDPSQFKRHSDLTKPQKVDPVDCARCDGKGVVSWGVRVGERGEKTCFRCMGLKTDPKYLEWGYPADWSDQQIIDHQQTLRQRAEDALERRARKLEEKRQAQVRANLERYPEIGEAYERWEKGEFRRIVEEDYTVTQEGHEFLQDVLGKVGRYDLTDKQVASIPEALRRYDEWQESLAAREAAKLKRWEKVPPFPRDKRHITGKIVSAKWAETTDYYGNPTTTLKMLVETPEGWRVYGTFPARLRTEIHEKVRGMVYDKKTGEPLFDPNEKRPEFLDAVKGLEVEFTATFKPAGHEDPTYGYFSGPSKAKLRLAKGFLNAVLAKHAQHNQEDHGNWADGQTTSEPAGRTSRVDPERGDEITLSRKARSKYGFTGPLRAVIEGVRTPSEYEVRRSRDRAIEDVQIRLIEQHQQENPGFPTRFWIDSRYIADGPLSTGHPDRPLTIAKHGGGSHDQSSHGNWARGISSPQLAAETDEPGEGFTVEERTGHRPSSGFVSAVPGAEQPIPAAEFTPRHIADYRRQHAALLAQPGNHLGAWYDSDTDIIYLDVSRVFSDRQEALDFARSSDQLAIFDLSTFEEIRLDDLTSVAARRVPLFLQ